MRELRAVGILVAVALGAGPVRLSAQSSTNLVDQMSNLFVQSVVLARTPGGGGIVAHTPVFVNDPTVTDVTNLINQVSQQIGLQTSLSPVGSSSGGFTYAFDSSLGTFSRTTNTFGPAFAERALTAGKNKFSFGINYLHNDYSSLDGLDLQSGDIKFNLLHQALTPPSFVQGDVIQAALNMKLSSDTTAFLFNYGVTDRLDIGLAVPIVRVKMDLSYHATILDFATHTVSPTTHVFADGSKVQDFSTSGSASGVGDVSVLAKYNFVRQGSRGLAVAIDLTAPTGDDKNMLGSGATLTKVFLVASGGDRISPHVNVGYTFAGGGSGAVGNQANYTGGVEIEAAPKLTIVGDLVGRTLSSTYRFNASTTPHPFQQGATAPIESTLLQGISSTTGSLTTGLGAVGIKFNPAGSLLISAHALFSLNDSGLRSKVTPVVGLDYTF